MDKFQVLHLIGEGCFGKVFKGRVRFTGQTVALKLIPLRGKSERELHNLRQEISILRMLRAHPHIIRMYDAFENGTDYVVVTEYAHGELFEVFQDDRQLPEEQIRLIARQLVTALHYLHSNRIIHRDMKPQNILIGSEGKVKLCDFGFARAMSRNTTVVNSIKGTPLYMAPELVQEKPYTNAADLWSLGVILYELFVGKPPFYTNSLYSLINLIIHEQVKYPTNISPLFKSFLQGLLVKNADQRLNWPALLQHPFIAESGTSPRSMLSIKENETLGLNDLTVPKEDSVNPRNDSVNPRNDVTGNNTKRVDGVSHMVRRVVEPAAQGPEPSANQRVDAASPVPSSYGHSNPMRSPDTAHRSDSQRTESGHDSGGNSSKAMSRTPSVLAAPRPSQAQKRPVVQYKYVPAPAVPAAAVSEDVSLLNQVSAREPADTRNETGALRWPDAVFSLERLLKVGRQYELESFCDLLTPSSQSGAALKKRHMDVFFELLPFCLKESWNQRSTVRAVYFIVSHWPEPGAAKLVELGGLKLARIKRWLSDPVLCETSLSLMSVIARSGKNFYAPLESELAPCSDICNLLNACLQPRSSNLSDHDESNSSQQKWSTLAKTCSLVGNLARHSSFFYEQLRPTISALTDASLHEDPSVRKFASFALGNLGFHSDDLYEDLAGSISCLVALLVNASEDEKTRSNAAGALGNFARNSTGLVPALLDNGVVEALVESARSLLHESMDASGSDPAGNLSVLRIALFSLGNMSLHAACRAKLVEMNCHALCSEILGQVHSEDIMTTKYCNRLLQKLGTMGSVRSGGG